MFFKTVNKGVKVRIYPNRRQEEQFHNNFGASRFVYNNILDRLKKLYNTYPNQYKLDMKLINEFLKQLKVENSFLKEIESTSLQQSSRDLFKSYQNFFKNPKANFPKFHSKKNTRLSFRQTIADYPVQNKYLKLRKYGFIRYRTSKKYYQLLNSNIKINNITITCDNGKYYAILNIETKIEQWPITNQSKGYDLNSNKNHFLVSNTGEKYQFNVNRENQMIKKLNISLSTKKKGSRAFKKIQKRLHKWYDKRTNKLNDYIQKLSTKLVKENDTIVLEDNWTNIKILIGGEQNMIFPLMKLKEMINYKFNWYKPNSTGIITVNLKWTSKTCHHCQEIINELKPSIRKWTCPNCGNILDRDINAAINILNRWDDGDCLSTRC